MKKLHSYFRVVITLAVIIAGGFTIRAISGCSSNIPGLNICDGGTCKVDVDVNVSWGGSSSTPTETTRAPVHISPIGSAAAVSVMFNDKTAAILPNPATSSYPPLGTNPFAISEKGVVDIQGRSNYNCLLNDEGIVKCGGNDPGRSIGTTFNNVVNLQGVSKISINPGGGVLAISNDGTVYSWSGGSELTPTSIGVTGAKDISSGVGHTCVVLLNGTVWCWGYNNSGQLGNNSTTNSSTPVQAVGVTTATQVVVQTNSTCSLLADHSVMCWGDNSGGELGNGTTTNSLVPTQVSSIDSATLLQTGGALQSSTFCIVATMGDVYCWGGNSGSWNSYTNNLYPRHLGLAEKITDLAGAVALTRDNILFWGTEYYPDITVLIGTKFW